MNPKEVKEIIESDPELFLAMAQEMAKSNPGIRKIMDTLNREAMNDRAKSMSGLTNSSDREVTQEVAMEALDRLNRSSQYRREQEAFLAGEEPGGYVSGNIPMSAIVTVIEYARQQQRQVSPEPNYDAIKGRRIGELSIDEHADAYELWVRNNITHGHQNYEMIRFLLERLDQSRGKVDQVLAPSDNRTLDSTANTSTDEDIDLFEDMDSLPNDVRAICDHYSAKMAIGDGDPNLLCRNFLQEVEAIGYTFEYGLDAEPYGLQKRPAANTSAHAHEDVDLIMDDDDDLDDGPGLQ